MDEDQKKVISEVSVYVMSIMSRLYVQALSDYASCGGDTERPLVDILNEMELDRRLIAKVTKLTSSVREDMTKVESTEYQNFINSMCMLVYDHFFENADVHGIATKVFEANE